MNFTREDRKKVYDFFESILTNYYTEPVYYEYVRGHVSKAPGVVKQYIHKKCRGDNLLEYFRKRKNYFEVEGTRISLRKEPRIKTYPERDSVKKKKLRKPIKFNRQRSEDSFSSTSSNPVDTSCKPSDLTQKLEHEEFVLKYFIRLLESNAPVILDSIDFEKLPKKVIRHLTLYWNKSVLNYFSNFPETFCIDDDGNVNLSNETKICNPPIPESDIKPFCEKNQCIAISPEVQNAYIWLESIEFFSDILKRQKTMSLHIDKLASHLTQAVEGVKAYLKTYKPFKTFFLSLSLIFYLKEEEVVLSDHYKNVLQLARGRIQSAFNEPESDASLSSDLHEIVNVRNVSDTDLIWDLDEDQWMDDEVSDTESIIEISDEEDNKNIEQKDENVFEITIKSEEDISNEKEREEIYSLEPENSSWAESVEYEPDVESSKAVNSDECDANLLRFLFTVETFCTEEVEKENYYSSQYTIKAIEFFVGILKDSSQKWTLTSLHGTLGQASLDVISFINKKYKAEKFSSFFQEHEEFLFKSPLVSLSPTFCDSFQKRLELFIKSEQEFCLENIYESISYKAVLRETFAFFFEVHQRLINNNKIKISRLSKIIEQFPNCLEWIKSTNGKTLLDKTESFLKIMNIFEFSNGGYISIASEKYNDNLGKWLQQMSEVFQNSKLNMPVFKLLNKANSTETGKLSYNCEKDCFWSLVEFFENILEDVCPLHYYEVVGILPTELLLKIAKTDKDSRIIISALLANKCFVKNGLITLNNSNHNSVRLDLSNGNDNSLDQTVQKSLTSNGHVNQIIATDIHVPGLKDSFTWSPICDSMEDIKGVVIKTEVSSELDQNTINENQILSKTGTNEKYKLHDNAYPYIPDLNKTVTSPDIQNFDSKVSNNQSHDSDSEVPLILSDTCVTSNILDGVSNGDCGTSDLSSLSIKKPPPISDLSNDNNDFDPEIMSPETEETNGYINFNPQSVLKMGEYDREYQFVINNVPESTREVLVEEYPADVIEVHSEEEIDIDAPLQTNKSVSKYRENNKENMMCEKSDNFTHSKVKSQENKVFVMDKNGKNTPNEDIYPTETKTCSNIFEMKRKANCLAREVFIKRGTFNKVFVASSNIVFHVIKGDILDGNKHSSEMIEDSLYCDESFPLIKDSFLTSSKSPDLEPSINEPDFLEKPKGCNDSFEYPLQPISAHVVLLTADSCIAQADIASRKQNIYFLKCVFSCEEENCCSECFNALCIGDSVSCFVPISEMSRKMWIPIMVSKEGSDNFNETDYINQVLKNQSLNGSYRQCEVGFKLPCQKYISENISTQTEYFGIEEECQTEILLKENFCQTEILLKVNCCQTDLSGEVKKKLSSCEVMCQTNSVLVQDVSLQAVCATNSTDCQTDISGFNAISTECQTDLMGNVKECVDTVNSLCQTNLSGNVKESVINDDSSSQTISTGPVMVMQYYHF